MAGKTKRARTGTKRARARAGGSRRETRAEAARGGAAAAPTVRVRMYRQGLGDCFLVTLNPGANQVSILIDFGTLGSATPLAKMSEVMDDIEAQTKRPGGKSRLDVLIATHEHQDHLSGFRTFKERFRQFEVGEVWLAWTEDKNDPLAKKLGDAKDISLALAKTAQALIEQPGAAHGMDAKAQGLGKAMQGLLEFVGEFGAHGFAPTVDEAMDFVRDSFGPPRFLKPGALIESIPGFRFYILGPPHSEKEIRDMGEHGDPRLYGLSGLAAAAAMQLDAVENANDCEREMPFDARFRRREGDAVLEPVLGSYLSDEAKWRRVDSDWLYNAPELALQFDSYINNTSLAFAIERVADGKVLLFPGDAQAGNWESWQALEWKLKKADGTDEVVKARDLLARTVFYKAGHHASHNGTVRGHGLEQMTRRSELVTFIPVDRKKALNHQPKWQMPANKLYGALIEASQGRVVRSDLGWVVDPSAQQGEEAEFGKIGTAALWKTWKEEQGAAGVKIENKWIDYEL